MYGANFVPGKIPFHGLSLGLRCKLSLVGCKLS